MKKLITSVLLLFTINLSFANNFMCASSGMTFLPEKKEISTNSMFIIEGYAFSQKTINSFKNRKVFLESNNKDQIELELVEILKGDMRLTQAIFKPKTELKSNTIYFLKYSNQTKEETRDIIKWNSKTGKREKVFWKTNDSKFLKLLNKNLQIKFDKTEVILYGCGPSVNAIFNVKNKTQEEIWFRTELIDLTTKFKKTFIIREWNKVLSVGHGMCSGAFIFKGKGKYKVRFTPMNTDGKMNKTTKWFIFDNPNSKNPSGF